MIKKILLGILVLVLIGVGVGVYLFNKPAHKVEDETSLSVSAVALAKEFSTDSAKANSEYLGKPIAVNGVVDEVDKNNGELVVLQTEDPLFGVECGMRDTTTTLTKGQKVTVKGYCSGAKMTGVSLTGCIIDKN